MSAALRLHDPLDRQALVLGGLPWPSTAAGTWGSWRRRSSCSGRRRRRGPGTVCGWTSISRTASRSPCGVVHDRHVDAHAVVEHAVVATARRSRPAPASMASVAGPGRSGAGRRARRLGSCGPAGWRPAAASSSSTAAACTSGRRSSATRWSSGRPSMLLVRGRHEQRVHRALEAEDAARPAGPPPGRASRRRRGRPRR